MSQDSETRQEILEMLATGKITVSEAAGMLSGGKSPETVVEKSPAGGDDLENLIKVEQDPAVEAIKSAQKKSLSEQEKPSAQEKPSWLRVRVMDLKSGRNKVTVNVPLRLVRFGLAIGSRFTPELDGFDWDEIDGYLSAERGMLVDVQDEEDGEHVQVFVD